MRVSYEEMKNELKRILIKKAIDENDAEELAIIFTENSLSGVPSHGINRFPVFINYIDNKKVLPTKATCEIATGAVERWNGHMGIGPLNAKRAMERACQLAKEYGIGMVALGNNNHWMRGATYGWQAANEGMIGICWTTSCANMAPWGGAEATIGNNPFVMSIPRENGEHAVVDFALCQYSYGKMENYQLLNKELPMVGGHDLSGRLSRNPEAIIKSKRALPIGCWKGSGFSMLLDMIGTTLAKGNSVKKISAFGDEIGSTQILIAIDPSKVIEPDQQEEILEEIIVSIKETSLMDGATEIRYPGEREYNKMKEGKEKGIEVVPQIWKLIKEM